MNFRRKITSAVTGLFMILILILIMAAFTSISVPKANTGKMQNMHTVPMHNR